MPRLTALLSSSPPMRFVGGELATHAFLRHMRRAGWDVAAHVVKTPLPYTWDGIMCRPWGPGPMFGDILLTHPDVRLDHGHNPRTIADESGMPLVYYVHNVEPQTVRAMRDTPADLTLFNAKATRDAAVELLGVDGPVMVPQVTTHDTRGSLAPRDSVGAVNMAASKGGLLVTYLAREMRTCRFLTIKGGHGIQNLPDPSMFPNLTLLDPVLPSHMPDTFYARIRLLLMLSERETYGMAGLEAAQSGVPTIATDLPGIREALGDAAVYVKPGDWLAAKDWIDILLSEPRLYREQQARALTRARAQHHEALQGFQLGHALLEHLAGRV